MPWLRIAALAVLLPACAGDDGGPSAVETCEQYADVVARAFADCGAGTYEQNFQAFEEALPGGDCDEADAIADRAALETECYDFFRESSCDVLTAPDIEDRVPDSCRGQVLFEE